MPRKVILLTVMLLAASGVVTAGTTTPDGCDEKAPREEMVAGMVPLRAGSGKYLFFPQNPADTQAAAKAGFWEEANPRDGLQTQACFKWGVVRVYNADAHQGLAIP